MMRMWFYLQLIQQQQNSDTSCGSSKVVFFVLLILLDIGGEWILSAGEPFDDFPFSVDVDTVGDDFVMAYQPEAPTSELLYLQQSEFVDRK